MDWRLRTGWRSDVQYRRYEMRFRICSNDPGPGMRFITASWATNFASRQCSHDSANIVPQGDIQFGLTPAIPPPLISGVHAGGNRKPFSTVTLGYGATERPPARTLP